MGLRSTDPQSLIHNYAFLKSLNTESFFTSCSICLVTKPDLNWYGTTYSLFLPPFGLIGNIFHCKNTTIFDYGVLYHVITLKLLDFKLADFLYSKRSPGSSPQPSTT